MSLSDFFRRLWSRADAPSPAPRTATYAAEEGLIEITAPAAPAACETERAHHQFIVAHWKRLAAAAFEGFRRYGIGVVIIEARERETDFEHPFTAHALAYATSLGLWTQTPPHSTDPDWLDEQFQTYEPRRAGLFLFQGGPSAPRPYHAAGTPAPPEAFRATRAPLN